MDNGLVSIIMPSYNTAQFIGASIESVESQTYDNWELIIVDDCSSDDTDAVVKKYADKDGRIHYLKNERNSGAAISRNRAMRDAKGKWIAFLDSDDLWMPEKLEKQINFMKQGGYHFSYTQYEEVDVQSNPLGIVVTGPKKITKQGMYNYCWLGCLTVMFDAEFVGQIQIKNIKKNNDYAMWLKICKKTDCFFLEENLAQYRRGRVGSISTHGYFSLIKWHYKLFYICDERNMFSAALLTCRNLFFGVIKKVKYVEKKRGE